MFIALAAMNVSPVLNGLGAPLALLAAGAAVFNPFAAILFVAGSQIAPDPPGLNLTLAQLFVAIWVVTLPFNGCLRDPFGAVFTGLKFMLPFIAIWLGMGIANNTIQIDWVYAFATAAILCTYLPMVRGRYRLSLWMLALGALLGILGHWGTSLGLAMEGKVYDQLLRGGLRMGSGRADVNFASVNVGFAVWTIAALLLPALWLKGVAGRLWRILAIAVVIVACAIPLIAMGSRGGLGYLTLGGLALGLYALNINAFKGRAFVTAMTLSGALVFFSPILWPMFLETEPGQRLVATFEYNDQQAAAVGAYSVAAGRAEIWGKFFDIAFDYPLTGAPKGAVVDMGEYGVAVIGGDYTDGSGAGGTGHNVFLDLAAGRGFPTAALFIVGFVAPIFLLIRRRGLAYALPFVIAHVMVFLPFMNLSIANWKTFWALHVITTMAAMASTMARGRARPTTTGRQRQ